MSACDDICFGGLLIPTDDRRNLTASCFRPPEPRDNNPWLIVASAMGVKRSFYRGLAESLASRGYGVITFDYRGIGDSAPDDLRSDASTIEDWGAHDLESVICWLRDAHRPGKLFILGHSVGGQVIGLAPSSRSADGLILVATQSGYWRNWHGRYRVGVWLWWHLILPVTNSVCGFFPARHLGMGENLPSGVARQWAKWGRHPQYLMKPGAECPRFHDEIACPAQAWFIRDDWLAPRDAMQGLLAWYSAADIEYHEIGGEDEPVGHWGWFRAETARAYWDKAVVWLERQGATD